MFNTEVGGVAFKLRRRTARLMLQIGNPAMVFGQLAADVKHGEFDPDRIAELQARLVDDMDKAMPLIVVEVAGEPVGEGYDFKQLDPFAEALFAEFLGSELGPGPSPTS